MKRRLITGLILVAVFLPAFLIGGWVTDVMVALVLGLGVYELTSFRTSAWPKWVMPLLYVYYLFLCYCLQSQLPWLMFGLFFLLSLLAIAEERFSFTDVTFYTVMGIFIGFAGRSVIMLANAGSLFIIFCAIITYSVDTGAYFGGRFFGKHALNKRISPKKTWEGSVSGFLIGVCAGLIYNQLFWHMPLPAVFLLACVLAVGGQFGDLIFSMIKRHYQIKDYGSLLPGHGGILDRIDSLLVNAIFMAMLLQFAVTL